MHEKYNDGKMKTTTATATATTTTAATTKNNNRSDGSGGNDRRLTIHHSRWESAENWMSKKMKIINSELFDLICILPFRSISEFVVVVVVVVVATVVGMLM